DAAEESTVRPSETSDTKIFVDSLGREVEVPVAPQRIVSGDSFNIIPQVLSLGGPLVGVPDETDDNVAVTRYYADELSSIERTGAQFEPNVEQIAALDPDLIIWGSVDTGFVGGLEGDTLQRLEGIAPVVAINHFQAIEDMMDHYAELLGPSANESVYDLQAEFEGALARLEEAFAPVRDELELAAVLAYDGGQDVFGTDFFLVQDIWTRLDANWVEVMDDADATDDRILSISEEEVERLESDLLVVLADPVNQLLDSPVYENLEVVQSGQVLVLDDSVFGQHYEAYVDLIETYREYLETTELRTDIVG
ncbi:MAG: ABC transporter substrate-binding protein, partial [Actinomycetota bacterium]